ncbi:hypothetical protein NVS55_18925 [Myxococcus stipitatus]|uniref:hypothetical protein n=1 Tax=Myxococcus stipitatus TaxID=83455 RepID=UPI00314515C2
MKTALLTMFIGLCLGAGASIAAESHDDTDILEESEADLAPSCDACLDGYDRCLEGCGENDPACESRCLRLFTPCFRNCI